MHLTSQGSGRAIEQQLGGSVCVRERKRDRQTERHHRCVKTSKWMGANDQIAHWLMLPSQTPLTKTQTNAMGTQSEDSGMPKCDCCTSNVEDFLAIMKPSFFSIHCKFSIQLPKWLHQSAVKSGWRPFDLQISLERTQTFAIWAVTANKMS